jgi:hypothetical protein
MAHHNGGPADNGRAVTSSVVTIAPSTDNERQASTDICSHEAIDHDAKEERSMSERALVVEANPSLQAVASATHATERHGAWDCKLAKTLPKALPTDSVAAVITRWPFEW